MYLTKRCLSLVLSNRYFQGVKAASA